MKSQPTITAAAAALALALVSCDPGPTGGPDGGESGGLIEVLRHGDGELVPVEEIAGPAVGDSFMVAGSEFMVTDRWPHTGVHRETSDDNPEESHAVEIGTEGGEGSRWIHQAATDAPAVVSDELDLEIRLDPPGARPAGPEDGGMAGQVQFLHEDRYHDLPEDGGEVFPGWKLKGSRSYQHALLDEEGGVQEAVDAGFVNRVLEVNLVSGDGSEERHIVFLDHPKITLGIHPSILPVARVSGEAVSLSRLVVRPSMRPSDEHHQVRISPLVDGAGLEVRVLRQGAADAELSTVSEFPAEVVLGEGRSISLRRHFTHARAQVRWERGEEDDPGKMRPALVVEHWQNKQPTRLVLAQGEITPCLVGGEMLMLRFRASGE